MTEENLMTGRFRAEFQATDLGRGPRWLHRYDPDGTLIGKLLLPEAAGNVTFGGIRRNNLFITNSAGDLYSIRVTFAGAK